MGLGAVLGAIIEGGDALCVEVVDKLLAVLQLGVGEAAEIVRFFVSLISVCWCPADASGPDEDMLIITVLKVE